MNLVTHLISILPSLSLPKPPPALTWLLLSAALDALFRAYPPERWVTKAEKSRALSSLVELSRGLGVEPSLVLRALQGLIATKAQGEPSRGPESAPPTTRCPSGGAS